jgi:predicted transcriptional regulator
MANATLARRDLLFSQTRAGVLLGVDRHTIRVLARVLKLQYKIDPSRSGKMLDRDDITAIADKLDVEVDWASYGQ